MCFYETVFPHKMKQQMVGGGIKKFDVCHQRFQSKIIFLSKKQPPPKIQYEQKVVERKFPSLPKCVITLHRDISERFCQLKG